MRTGQNQAGSRRGAAQVYMLICFPVLLGVCALAVDVGRAHLAKQELQGVADAAARYAARGMQTSSTPMATAIAHANAVVSESRVDGSTPVITSSDVVRGNYNANSKTFTASSTGDHVAVTVRQTLNRPGSVPLIVSSLTGGQKTLVASAVARSVSTSTDIAPPASGNLWLAGMPNNTVHRNFRNDASRVWDNSGTPSTPRQRPLMVSLSSLNVQGGATIGLEGITGTASWNNATPDSSTNAADGDAGFIVANGVAPANSLPTTSANGMSNTRAPIGAVMAVFMNDSAPNNSTPPSNLDFGTAAQRDYTSISPQLRQVFFIGDGKRANGEAQIITVPQGATRVFFGMMDAWQWNDNVGSFQTKLYIGSAVQLVK